MPFRPHSVVYKGESFECIDPDSPLPPGIDPAHFKNAAEAQQWITRRANWHDHQLFVDKWDSRLVPLVRRTEGQHIAEHPYDTGLAEAIVWKQRRARARSGSLDEPAAPEEAE